MSSKNQEACLFGGVYYSRHFLARLLSCIIGFISTIRDICRSATVLSDFFGLHLDKLNDDHLNYSDHVTHMENDFLKFNSKLLLHLRDGKNAEIKYYLKKQGDACYTVDSSGATLLHYAAQYQNAAMTERFINSGFNIDALDDQGNTPLLLAVSVGNQIGGATAKSTAIRKLESTIEVLLKEGANIHMVNKSGESALPIVFRYSTSEQANIVNMFLNKVKEESPNNKQVMARKLFAANCPLPLALRLGGSDLAREMLALGTSVDSCNRITGETALHEAIRLSDWESVKLLLERKPNMSAVDREKRVPLMNYNTRCDGTTEIEILKTLIGLHPNLNAELLKKFLSHGKRNAILAVVESGCDLFARNEYGETPVHFLARNPNAGIISQVLEGKRFDANARDRYGNTPLMDAVRDGHVRAVEFLLDHKADPNVANDAGLTALHSVFFSNSRLNDNHVKIVELLLLHGAKVQCDSREDTLFDLPSTEIYQRLITTVLAHLAKVEARGGSIDRTIRTKILTRKGLKNQYITFQQHLAEMKMYTVHETVTLFELLAESDEKIELYAANQEFISLFQSVMDNKYMNSYYLDVVRKRVAKAIEKLEAVNASASMCSIM